MIQRNATWAGIAPRTACRASGSENSWAACPPVIQWRSVADLGGHRHAGRAPARECADQLLAARSPYASAVPKKVTGIDRRVRHRRGLVDVTPIAAELPGTRPTTNTLPVILLPVRPNLRCLPGPRFALRANPCHARGG